MIFGRHKRATPKLFVQSVDHVAVGFGFSIIMAALDWIQQGVIPWTDIVADAMKNNPME